jgi:hypothetical protein
MPRAPAAAAWIALGAGIAIAIAPEGAAEPQAAVAVVKQGGPPVSLGPEQFSGLPTVTVTAGFGGRPASFEGPLLWSVLEKLGAIDAARHRDQVSQAVVVVGRDGYRAVLAVGEIAPEFEAKPVILADRLDGKPLPADHLRVVVPLDKRGGRSVRDVVRIEVGAPLNAQ